MEPDSIVADSIVADSIVADSIVQSVVKRFLDRSAVGQTYGTTLDRTDLKTLDWILHAQEELMPAKRAKGRYSLSGKTKEGNGRR